MLLALRSLWEFIAPPPPPALGGAWGGPRVNFADFMKLSDFLKLPKKKRPELALVLYTSGQVDLTTFAALLAASQE